MMIAHSFGQSLIIGASSGRRDTTHITRAPLSFLRTQQHEWLGDHRAEESRLSSFFLGFLRTGKKKLRHPGGGGANNYLK